MEKKTILIIEDDAILLSLLKQKLEEKGYNVLEEKNGISGFYAAENLTPDLIILDIVLPEMDGLTVLEKLRQNDKTKSLPVIIISNSGDVVEMERIKKLEVKDYLIKTDFEPQELLNKVNNFFSRQAKKEDEQKIKTEKENSDYSHFKNTIMIVEDDKFLMELISQKIEKEGMKTIVAITAEKAFVVLEKEKPQLILLDLILPGMSGFEFLEKLRSNHALSDIPVIALSNLGEEKDKEAAKKLGIKSFLVKAMSSPNEIVQEIKKVLEESYL